MPERIQILAAALSLLYLGFVLFKLRTQQLSINRSLFWLLSGILMFGLSLYPQPISDVAGYLGFAIPANALFILWLLILTTLSFSQTLALSSYDRQLRRLAQDYAIMRAFLRELGQSD